MSTIGYGYGSEWHLLRYLGYHRKTLNEEIYIAVGGDEVDWFDFGFSTTGGHLADDKELEGLSFIKDPAVKKAWRSYWPTTGRAPSWDAVARLSFADHPESEEILLIEAKAHIGEEKSKTGASGDSLAIIENAFLRTMRNLNVSEKHMDTWLYKYYQFANRLAVLNFLTNELSSPRPCHLLNIYFYGEKHRGWKCPVDAASWSSHIEDIYYEMGLSPEGSSSLISRVIEMYLPVNPNAKIPSYPFLEE